MKQETNISENIEPRRSSRKRIVLKSYAIALDLNEEEEEVVEKTSQVTETSCSRAASELSHSEGMNCNTSYSSSEATIERKSKLHI